MNFAQKQPVTMMVLFIQKQRDTFLGTQRVLEAAGIREALDHGVDAMYEMLESNPALCEVYDDWVDSYDNLAKANAHVGEHYSAEEKQRIKQAVGNTFFEIK